MKSLKSQKVNRSRSPDYKTGVTAIRGWNFMLDGANYVSQGLKWKVNTSPIQNGIHKRSSPFIKSLVRIEIWGKSLEEIRPGRWRQVARGGHPGEGRAGHTNLARKYSQVWTLSKKKEPQLCTPDCDSGERNPRTGSWGYWLLWLNIQNSGTMTGSTYTYLKTKRTWGKLRQEN